MFTTLVSTEELGKHLNDPGWVVFDCRFTLTNPDAGRAAYEKGHIPGARYAHLDNDLASPLTASTGRHPLPDPEDLARKLGEWGVGNDTQVVVYDDAFGAMAGRMWWLLRWLGHDKVAMLDGVYPQWVREKRPVTKDLPVIQKKEFKANLRDELWVSTGDVQKAIDENCCVLIDARAEERFSGEVEPLDKVAGHIPGAINRPYDDNLDFGGDFLSAEELLEEYQPLIDGHSPDHAIHMCGSGVTACHNLLAMEHAGLKGSRLYVGSWSEWITDSRRSVAKDIE